MLNPSLPVVLVNPATGAQIEVSTNEEYYDLVYGAGYRPAPATTPAATQDGTKDTTKDSNGGNETETA